MTPDQPEPAVPVRPAPEAARAADPPILLGPHDFYVERRAPLRPRRTLRSRVRLSVALFLLTAVSLVLAGCYLGQGLLAPLEIFAYTGQLYLPTPTDIRGAFVYAGSLLLILFAHEMGHYLQARRHGVPATLPFFIPFPISPFGTMGAVILQDGSRADRRKLFDIAISGPLAGLVVALPISWYGVATSRVFTFTPSPSSVHYGDPILLRWIVEAVHGPYGPGQDVLLNAPLFAGWVGIFITALNLLPVGQLDGGHILYALVGRRAHLVAYAVLAAAVAWMAYGWYGHQRPPTFMLMVILLFLMGPKHPPTADDTVPLGPIRIILGWLSLAFVIVGFTPTPIG